MPVREQGVTITARHDARLGLLFAVSIAVLGAALLGVVYGWFDHENVFYEVNTLATLGLGYAVGHLCARGAAAGSVESPGARTALGIVAGTTAVYGAWVAWLHATLASAGYTGWVLDPFEIAEYMRQIASVGAWTIEHATPTGGMLWATWTAEAAAIIAIAAVVTRAGANRL